MRSSSVALSSASDEIERHSHEELLRDLERARKQVREGEERYTSLEVCVCVAIRLCVCVCV